jgi:hypothetical protein
VGVVEAGFRLARFDFAFQRQAFERTPIFYRQPIVPLGNGLFRRPGPARWEGLVVTPLRKRAGVPEELMPDELPVLVRYDSEGFRNPEGFDDWEVVVAGDSFTELGHLPDAALFTARLGSQLSLRVKGLGVSYTGPFSQTAYLERWGSAPSARHAVLAFFEGNDVGDAAREERMLGAARDSPKAPSPEPSPTRLDAIQPQSSFVKAIWELPARVCRPEPRHLPNAGFEAGGVVVPVSIMYAPPDPARIPARAANSVRRALGAWATTAKHQGLQPWLLYLPTKRRVLHQHLRFTREAEPRFVRWRPTSLPRWIQREAERHGITFLDATPALRAEADAGRLPYNAVWDTHLNARGAEIVARVLAVALRSAARPTPQEGRCSVD